MNIREGKDMSTMNPPKRRKIFHIFSLEQLDKILDEIESSPLPDNWYVDAEEGSWKEYVSASKYLRFREKISHEEIEKLLGPATNGNGDKEFMIELWEFDGFSDNEYDYRFYISISFVDDVATTGIVYWKKVTIE